MNVKSIFLLSWVSYHNCLLQNTHDYAVFLFNESDESVNVSDDFLLQVKLIGSQLAKFDIMKM